MHHRPKKKIVRETSTKVNTTALRTEEAKEIQRSGGKSEWEVEEEKEEGSRAITTVSEITNASINSTIKLSSTSVCFLSASSWMWLLSHNNTLIYNA